VVWSPEEPPPPALGVPLYSDDWRFQPRKNPKSLTNHSKGLGMQHCFCMYSVHLFQLWSQKLAPLRWRGFILNLLWRFFLNRYSSWQVNILSAYSAISPQIIRTVVCFFGGVWWSASDHVTERDFGWSMEMYAGDTWWILACWVPWVYKVMIRLYESELEFGHVWFIRFF
jgi:hypothetical protein